MRSNNVVWISFMASIISLVVSIVVLVNYCPTQNLQFDYMGVIVGILAILVTSLIGAQVGQYVFVDKKIKSISKPITRIIARQVAAEVAHQETPAIAKSAASEAVDAIVSDFSLIMKGLDLVYKAKNDRMIFEYMSAIDNLFEAIAVYVQCQNEKMSESSIKDALHYLNNACEQCKIHGGARVIEGRKEYYIKVLKEINQDTKRIMDYLKEAKNMPTDTDYKIREKEVVEGFEV